MPDPTPAPPYLARVLDLAIPAALAAPGGLSEIFVLHDEWCPLLAGGACACSPVVTAGVVLWHRGRKGKRRGPWEPLGTFATVRQAWARIGADGRTGGDYCALPVGREP